MTTFDIQLLAEENQVRLELQMALDSKESDIEQLRCQLSTLSVHSLDSTSISSGNDLDTSEGYPGMPRRLLGVLSAALTLASQVLVVSFVFSFSLKLPGLLFSPVPHADSIPPPSPPHFHCSPLRSAHYSLPHLRIYVLHLPAHTQIRLHRHTAPPVLGSL